MNVNSFVMLYFFTPFCVENAQMATLPSLIYAHIVGVLNEKSCNITNSIKLLFNFLRFFSYVN